MDIILLVIIAFALVSTTIVILHYVKPRRKKKPQTEVEQEVEYFKDKLYQALFTLVSGAHTTQLRWWEVIIIVVCGAFLGIGLGVVTYLVLIPKSPKILLIPLNETSIIRVNIP